MGLKFIFGLEIGKNRPKCKKTDQNAKKQTKSRPQNPKSLLNRPKSVKTDPLSSTAIAL